MLKRDTDAINQAMAPGGWMQQDFHNTAARLEWWNEATFGCFVHWGVYAIAGGEWNGRQSGYAEHLQRVMCFTKAEYTELFVNNFNPVNFDADEWIAAVKAAGMRYFVITAKHHDGFAMNPSDVYPYDIRMTPFGRDPIEELRVACKKEGIRFGIYYSHAFDWEHPDAPGNDWEFKNGGGDKRLFEGPNGLWFNEHPELVEKTARGYVDGKSIPQILELIENYQPDLLWFDTAHKLPISENLRILRAIRQADPNVVVNGRLAPVDGIPTADYINTADRAAEFFSEPGAWETIPTTNESYGYSKVDKSHKPPEHFIRLLAKAAARGGRVLMNVGPTALGEIDGVDLDILKTIGEWMQVNGESIYSTQRSPLCTQPFGETTLKGNKLYLHVFEPGSGSITLGGMLNHVKKAYLLADPAKTPLPIQRLNTFDTEIALPSDLPESCNTVVVVEFEGELLHDKSRLLARQNYLRAFDASHISPALSHGDGKFGRDHISNFTHTEQTVIWNVRPAVFGQYKLNLRYSTRTKEITGAYSIYVNGQQHVRQITSSPSPEEYTTHDFIVELNGEGLPGTATFDIVFRPVDITGEFVHLYGVEMELVQEQQGSAGKEIDDTDTGDA
ncbi:MAG: alpha-L-fucosidase [Oscillospiraceae bacterium]|nr:alpha-L-fucosidase [Oscillospiraceae bacterium]